MILIEKENEYTAKILFHSLMNKGTSNVATQFKEFRERDLEFFPSVLSWRKTTATRRLQTTVGRR